MVGEPVTVSVQVGSYQGAEFNGLVRIALRAEGETHPLEKVVERPKGERSWEASFVPQSEGQHALEISFRTTRKKVLLGSFPVSSGRMPRWPWYVMAALAVAVAVGLGTRMALKKGE